LTFTSLHFAAVASFDLSTQAALGESPAEIAMRAHVEKVLQENGQSMMTA